MVRGTIRTLAWAAVATTGLLHVGRLVPLRSMGATSAVTLAPLSLVAAASAVPALLATGGRCEAMFGAVVLAGGKAVHVAPFRRSRRSAERVERSDLQLTVMTANLLHGAADTDALAQVADRHGVDILCVQEVHQETLDDIGIRLGSRLPHRLSLGGDFGAGAGIFSRHPLTNQRFPPGFGFPPVMADVQVPVGGRSAGGPGRTRTISVLSFHSKAPVADRTARHWLADLARLAELMDRHAGTLIVAGDFNATRDHRQFRDLLTGGYSDAAQDAGAGLTLTFPAKPYRIPIACLDHVLVGRGLVGVQAFTVPTVGSDHRSVIARIAAD